MLNLKIRTPKKAPIDLRGPYVVPRSRVPVPTQKAKD
jgi:hypothetical protein